MQLFGQRRHRYGALSGTAGIVVMLVLLLFRVLGSGGTDRSRSTYDPFEIEAEPIESPEHLAGAYYPDGSREIPATDSSTMVPFVVAGLGGLVVLGGLGAVAFMLFREEDDGEQVEA